MGGKLGKRKKGYDVSDPKEKKEETAVASAAPAEKKEEAPVTESEPQEATPEEPVAATEASTAALEGPAAVPEMSVTEEPAAAPKDDAILPEPSVTEKPVAAPEEPAAVLEIPVAEKPAASPEEQVVLSEAPVAEEPAVAPKEPAATPKTSEEPAAVAVQPVAEEPAATPEASVTISEKVAEPPAAVPEEPLPAEPVQKQITEEVVEKIENANEVSTEMIETTKAMPEPETVTETAAPELVAEGLNTAEEEGPNPEKPTPITEPVSQTAALPEATLTQEEPEPVPEQKTIEESIPAIVILESTSTNEISSEEIVPTVTDVKLNNGEYENAAEPESAPLEVNGECHEKAPEVAHVNAPEPPSEECVNGVNHKETCEEQSDCELKKEVPLPIGDVVEVPQ